MERNSRRGGGFAGVSAKRKLGLCHDNGHVMCSNILQVADSSILQRLYVVEWA